MEAQNIEYKRDWSDEYIKGISNNLKTENCQQKC
jgi:hypothetical protein